MAGFPYVSAIGPLLSAASKVAGGDVGGIGSDLGAAVGGLIGMPEIGAVVGGAGEAVLSGRSEEAFESLSPTATSTDVISVTIPAGGRVKVQHKMSKVPEVGWQLHRKMGAGDVWDYQAPDNVHVFLETNAPADLPVRITVA